VFTPAEVSCRECRKRWQQAASAEQAQAMLPKRFFVILHFGAGVMPETIGSYPTLRAARAACERHARTRLHWSPNGPDTSTAKSAAGEYAILDTKKAALPPSSPPSPAAAVPPRKPPSTRVKDSAAAKEQFGPPPQDAAGWAALRTMAMPGIPPAERYRAAFQERSASGVEGKLQLVGD
jgi:hypothetical protein